MLKFQQPAIIEVLDGVVDIDADVVPVDGEKYHLV